MPRDAGVNDPEAVDWQNHETDEKQLANLRGQIRFGWMLWCLGTDDELPPVVVMLSLNIWGDRDSSYIKRAS